MGTPSAARSRHRSRRAADSRWILGCLSDAEVDALHAFYMVWNGIAERTHDRLPWSVVEAQELPESDELRRAAASALGVFGTRCTYRCARVRARPPRRDPGLIDGQRPRRRITLRIHRTRRTPNSKASQAPGVSTPCMHDNPNPAGEPTLNTTVNPNRRHCSPATVSQHARPNLKRVCPKTPGTTQARCPGTYRLASFALRGLRVGASPMACRGPPPQPPR
jgi:hypothetical protein